jgi:DNA mismatch endonuclease (patch repair protein)
MQSTPGKDNSAEKSLRSALHKRGLRFRIHRPVPATRRTIDVAFPGVRVAVFIDGCFWHGCPLHGTCPKNNASWWREKIAANQERDADTVRRLSALGWIVFRIWEHEDPEAVAAIIEETVRQRFVQESGRTNTTSR